MQQEFVCYFNFIKISTCTNCCLIECLYNRIDLLSIYINSLWERKKISLFCFLLSFTLHFFKVYFIPICFLFMVEHWDWLSNIGAPSVLFLTPLCGFATKKFDFCILSFNAGLIMGASFVVIPSPYHVIETNSDDTDQSDMNAQRV